MNCLFEHDVVQILETKPSSQGGGRVSFRLADSESAPFMRSRTSTAFSLVEVMVACGIFFLAIFTILALVSSTLRNARGLRRRDVDAGMVAAGLFKTNKLYEGSDSGDFGDLYPDYSWTTETYEAATNGLWEVDITIHRRGNTQPTDNMSVWIFSPDSSSGPFGGNRFGGMR